MDRSGTFGFGVARRRRVWAGEDGSQGRGGVLITWFEPRTVSQKGLVTARYRYERASMRQEGRDMKGVAGGGG